MGINNIEVLVADTPEEPKKPRCSRCNMDSYEGEISIEIAREKLFSFSLCGFCLPIMRDRLIGWVENQMNIIR